MAPSPLFESRSAAQKLVTSLEIASEYARIFSALTNAIGNRIG